MNAEKMYDIVKTETVTYVRTVPQSVLEEILSYANHTFDPSIPLHELGDKVSDGLLSRFDPFHDYDEEWLEKYGEVTGAVITIEPVDNDDE